jgi:predicted aspartyl protease
MSRCEKIILNGFVAMACLVIAISVCNGATGTVPMEKHGTHLYLPVAINGVTGMFVLDTGARSLSGIRLSRAVAVYSVICFTSPS